MDPEVTATTTATTSSAADTGAAPGLATDAVPRPAERGAPVPGRRRFLQWLGGLTVISTGAMVLTPIVGFLIPGAAGQASAGGKVLVAKTSDIPPGSGKVVAMGSKPAVIVNTDQGIKAYSAICTHLGCVVAFNDLTGLIECPCHGGEFNPGSGAVVSGPPPAPLPPLTVSVEGDQIFLTEA